MNSCFSTAWNFSLPFPTSFLGLMCLRGHDLEQVIAVIVVMCVWLQTRQEGLGVAGQQEWLQHGTEARTGAIFIQTRGRRDTFWFEEVSRRHSSDQTCLWLYLLCDLISTYHSLFITDSWLTSCFLFRFYFSISEILLQFYY